MTYDIDCHVLTNPDLNQAWLDEALESLQGQACNVFVLPGYRGDITRGRMEGFQMGTAKYVTFLDDDDTVTPNTMEKVVEEMERGGHSSLFTMEHACKDGQVQAARPFHHLWVARRELLMPLIPQHQDIIQGLDKIALSSYGLQSLLPYVHMDWVGYRWNIDRGLSHRKFSGRSHKYEPDQVLCN